LINEDGPTLAAVPNQVALSIAVDIDLAHHARALNGCLPNGGVDGLPLSRDIPRQAYVDRK
jgi:hypothetical protein